MLRLFLAVGDASIFYLKKEDFLGFLPKIAAFPVYLVAHYF